MQDSEIILNKSKTYLLYYFSEIIGISFFKQLMNTYLFFEGERYACFLYKYSGTKKFATYERSVEKHPCYVKTIDVSSDKVLFVMKCPDELEDVIDTFLKGKYSELPEKENLINFLKSNFGATDESTIIKVINKDAGLRRELEEKIGQSIGDLDLSSVPDFDKENFTKRLYEKEIEHNNNEEPDCLQHENNGDGHCKDT